MINNKILLEFIGKRHSLYDSLIKFPPKDYEIISPPEPMSSESKLNRIYSNISRTMPFIPLKLLNSYFNTKNKQYDPYKIIYSAGHVNFSSKQWIVDFEYATHLVGYNELQFKLYKHIIEKELKSDRCKYLLPWTIKSKKTIELCFNNMNINKKILLLPLAVPTHEIKTKRNNENVKFLFISSKNFPYDFFNKGGLLVLETFKQLQLKYNNLELFIRAKIPANIISNYRDLKNIHILDKILPTTTYDKLLSNMDVFLYPCHTTPALAFLDAMSYGLPIITTDVWANPEIVINNYNGLLIKSPLTKFIDDRQIPIWGSKKFIMQSTIINKDLISKLYNASEILINDPSLRKKLGKNGWNEINNGDHSINRRNNKLKQIFDSL